MSTRAGKCPVDNGELAFEVAGEGPALVLIHGFSLDMRMWRPQFEALAAAFTVVRYDLRGFGRSSAPCAEYDHCSDLAQLLGHLGIDRPLLVGLSLGANIALRYATLCPENVHGLVLASPGLPGHAWKEMRPPEAALARARAHGVKAAKQFWLGHEMFASLDDYPQAKAEVAEIVADYSGWHWRGTDMQAPAEPIIPQLEHIRAPALVISGDRDVAGYREIAQRIADSVPGASLLRLETAGHMLNLEQPEIFTDAVRRFAASQMLEA